MDMVGVNLHIEQGGEAQVPTLRPTLPYLSKPHYGYAAGNPYSGVL